MHLHTVVILLLMRTSIIVDDRILAQARRRAREQGLTLSAYVTAALQRDLTARPQRKARPFRLVTVAGGRLMPGLSWEKLEHQANDIDHASATRRR